MFRIDELAKSFNNSINFNGDVLFNESMKEHTTMKVGGNAAMFLKPNDIQSLIHAISECIENDIKFFILGGGSNLVVSDEGFDGIIISTEKFNIIEEIDETHIKCGAGVKTDDLVQYCASRGFAGLETFSALPGTVGGASFMNARCYGKEISDILSDAEFIEPKEFCKKRKIFVEQYTKMYHNSNRNLEWAYKVSPFATNLAVILNVTFTVQKKDESKIDFLKSECERYKQDREQKGHFKSPSAGSVFKNNRDFGLPSGKLIDEAGLKGCKIGGAQIAPFHGNIIINTGNATCSDVESLVQLARQKVLENKGFELEPEIIFLK